MGSQTQIQTTMKSITPALLIVLSLTDNWKSLTKKLNNALLTIIYIFNFQIKQVYFFPKKNKLNKYIIFLVVSFLALPPNIVLFPPLQPDYFFFVVNFVVNYGRKWPLISVFQCNFLTNIENPIECSNKFSISLFLFAFLLFQLLNPFLFHRRSSSSLTDYTNNHGTNPHHRDFTIIFRQNLHNKPVQFHETSIISTNYIL